MNAKEAKLAKNAGLSMSQKLFLDITDSWVIFENEGADKAFDRTRFWKDKVPDGVPGWLKLERVCSLEDGIAVALGSLSEKEVEILRMRYFDDFTFRQIGININKSAQTVQQIAAKSLRRLRHPRRFGYILGFRDLPKPEFPEPKTYALRETPIEDLMLSVRCFNCLKRAGYSTIGDVLDASREEIEHIRNLGRNATGELYAALEEYTNNHPF